MRAAIQFAQKLLTRLLIAGLIFMMSIIMIRMFTQHVLVNRYAMDNAFTRLVLSNSEAGTRGDQTAAPQPPAAGNGIAGRYLALQYRASQAAERYTHVIDEHANHQLPYRARLVEAANTYESRIGWNLAGAAEYNNAVDMEEGYLVNFSPWTDVYGNAWHVADFKGYLDTLGIPLLFVQLPGKIDIHDTEMNEVVDFYNSNADRLIDVMQKYGVDVLDLRRNIEVRGHEYQALFFNTDHHWRPETGLWAARTIAEELKKNYGLAVDPSLLADDNFRKDIFERWFLGSLGKKLTLARAVPDDFTLLYPTFPVDWTLRIPSLEMDQRGGFDIIYDYAQVEPKDLYNKDPYGAYMHSSGTDHGFVQIENHAVPAEGSHVLMLGDSFSNTILPFLGLEMERIDKVDLRNYTGSLRDMIEQNQYSMVVIAYSSLFQVELNTGTSMYDFR